MSRRSSQTRTDNRLDTSSMTNKNQPKNLYRHIIYKDAVFFPTQGDRLIESPIFSSLALQKLMYFNIYYNFLFFYLMLVTFIYKLWVMDLGDAFHIVRPILLAVWAVIEAFRFHNGYVGNLKETFPDLFFFNLLSFGSIGIVIAMLVPGKTFPIEVACEVIFVIFGVLEVIIGYYAMMKLSVSQEALFYLRSANSQIRMKREDRDSFEKRGDGETSRLLKDNSGGEIELARGQRSPRSAEQIPENRGPENRGARRALGGGKRTGYNQLAQED